MKPLLFFLCLVVAATADTLSLAHRKSNETIKLYFASAGCYHEFERLYVFEGDAKTVMIVYQRTWKKGQDEATEEEIGRLVLSESEIAGIDAAVALLRLGPLEGRFTTTDFYPFQYFRDGLLIGKEDFTDRTGTFRLREVKRCPPNFSIEQYQKIITPFEIELQRLRSKRPNQRPEGTKGKCPPSKSSQPHGVPHP